MIIEKRMTELEAHEKAVQWYRLAQRSTPNVAPPLPRDYGDTGEKAYSISVGFDMHYLIFKPDTNESKETNQSN